MKPFKQTFVVHSIQESRGGPLAKDANQRIWRLTVVTGYELELRKVSRGS